MNLDHYKNYIFGISFNKNVKILNLGFEILLFFSKLQLIIDYGEQLSKIHKCGPPFSASKTQSESEFTSDNVTVCGDHCCKL